MLCRYQDLPQHLWQVLGRDGYCLYMGFFAGSPFPSAMPPMPGLTGPILKYTQWKKTKLKHHHVLLNPGLVYHTWEGPHQRALLKTPNVQWQVTPRHGASSSPTPTRPELARSWHVSSVPPHPILLPNEPCILGSLSGVTPKKGYLFRLVKQHSKSQHLCSKKKITKKIKK